MDNPLEVTIAIPDQQQFDAVRKAAADVGFIEQTAFPRLGLVIGTIPIGKTQEMIG